MDCLYVFRSTQSATTTSGNVVPWSYCYI